MDGENMHSQTNVQIQLHRKINKRKNNPLHRKGFIYGNKRESPQMKIMRMKGFLQISESIGL